MKQSTTTAFLGTKMVVPALAVALIILPAAWAMAQNYECPGDPGNEDMAGATQLGSTCQTLAEAIDCEADWDYYEFYPPTTGAYAFVLTSDVALAVRVIRQGSDVGYDETDGAGSQGTITIPMTAGELYYIRVQGVSTSTTGSYTLDISGCDGNCGNDPGNNDIPNATPIHDCGTTSAAIDCPADVDYYSFVATISDTFTFETTGSTDTYLRLYDSNGSLLNHDDDSGADHNARVTYGLTYGHPYYVAVNEYNYDDTGDYSLVISGCPPACGNDPGDDSTATATPFGGSCGSKSAAIDCTGDIDYYSFNAPSDGTYTFDVSASNAYNITLYSNTGNLLEGPSGSPLSHTLSSGQLVYVRVMAGADGLLLDYALVISGCSGGGDCGDDPGNDYLAEATPLPGCGTTQAAIDCVGDLDYYWLNAPNSGSFTFETTGSTDTELRLYDANGDAIASDDDSGADTNARITYTLVGGQKYSVAVNEYGNNGTGDYALVISGCTGGGCGNDPGDDTTDTATPFGGSCGTKPASIDCTGDIDFFSFNAPSDGTYTFDVSASNAYNITLYSNTGNLLEGPSGSPLSHTLSSGQLVYVRVMAGADGLLLDYALVISGCSGGGDCGDDPGNDYLAEATPLPGCGTTQAAIDCVGDLDYYWLNAPNSGSFTFETTGSTDTELRLYDANGDAIASDDDSGADTNARITYTLVGGQKYSVAVNEYGNNGTGDYALVISGCTGGGCGTDPGNDDLASATALAGCPTTHAGIDCIGDVDVYKIIAPNSGNYSFDSYSGETDTALVIFDSNGVSIASDDNSGNGHSAHIDLDLTGGLTYFIQVNESGNDATGSYTLQIGGCSAGGCGNDPGNDDPNTATVLSGCGSTPAAFDCTGDIDYYSLVTPSSGSFTFETTGSSDTLLQLFDGSGNQIDQDDDSGTDRNARIVAQLSAGQTYRVRVSEYNDDDTGDYTLVVSGCSTGGCGNDPGNDAFGSATAIQECGATSAAIDCATDQDYYQFNPANSGAHTFTIQVSFNALIELYDANHALLGQDSYQITHDLQPSSGPYFIAVVSPLYLTGDYDLTISGCDNPGGDCTGDTDGDTPAAATLFPGCGSTSAAFDCTGDVDYFKFIPTTSGAHAFETTGSMDTKMWLENTQGNDLDFDDDSGQGSNSRIEWSLQSGMQYFIRVEEYNNDDTGNYGLTVTGCNTSSCGQDSEGDTIATSVNLSTCGVTEGRFDCSGDVDVFRFEAPLSADFTFRTTGALDTFIRLLDGNGNPLASDDNSGSGGNASLMHSMTAGEAVYLEVIENGGQEGAYSIEIEGCEVTGEPPNQFLYIITSVAKVAGSAGTDWVSDVAILNVGEGTGNVTISRWERDRANMNPQEVHRTLGAGELERTTDVLFSLFGQPQGAAALHVLSDQPLVIGSRTYNTVDDKTYGQFIPGVGLHDAIPAGEQVILSGLTENDAFRTNLGLVNPGDSEIEVTGTFFDSGSNSLGSRSWTVPAHGYIQRNRVLRELTGNPISDVWIRLSTNAGEFFSFLSIIDQQSGDPVYRPGRTAPAASGDVLIPGVAKLAGAAGTNWVTDTVFTNTTQSDSSIKISLWKRDQDNSNPTQRSFQLKAERMVTLPDVLFSLFGENAGAAALDVTIEPGILADGRTYNQVKEGTYGQYIPALSEGAAVTNHRKGFLVMPAQNSGFRANLGLVNPSTTAVDVEVRLVDASGIQLGNTRTWTLTGRAVKQIDRIVRQFTNEDLDSGWLEISVKNSTPDGQVLIFNSVVDQVSGDPIFEGITLAP
ncbi:MAG: hypothetical protein ABFS37_01580 [Acidobacteriota bacterium]